MDHSLSHSPIACEQPYSLLSRLPRSDRPQGAEYYPASTLFVAQMFLHRIASFGLPIYLADTGLCSIAVFISESHLKSPASGGGAPADVVMITACCQVGQWRGTTTFITHT
jgi:hypothetical protein